LHYKYCKEGQFRMKKHKKNRMKCYICGRRATKTRTIEGYTISLCKYHNTSNINILDAR